MFRSFWHLQRDPVKQLLFSNHYTKGETETSGVESLAQDYTAGKDSSLGALDTTLCYFPQDGVIFTLVFNKQVIHKHIF